MRSREETPLPLVPWWCAEVEVLFLDLDGCVWFGERLAEHAAITVGRLRECGKRVVFLSNVSSATREDIAAKLTRLGITASASDVQVPLGLLPKHPFLSTPETRVLALCATRVADALREMGLPLVGEPEEADVVVVGRDTEMRYGDLAAATQALNLGARLLALNLDSRVPLENGVIAPGAGAIVAALVEATGAKVEVVGKPSDFFFRAALEDFGVSAAKAAMVGDNLDSDIVGGQRVGLWTVQVGRSSFSRLERPPVPHLEVDAVSHLTHYFC